MRRLLKRYLDDLIETGDLSITFSDGSRARYGDGTGPATHLRFNNRQSERQVVLDPHLKFAEAYMRAEAMPGEDPESVPHPSLVAAKIIRLADPNLSETGMLFDAAQDRFVSYRKPT